MSALHGSWLVPGEWWACQFPERPANDQAVFEERCPACVIAAGADLAANGDREMFDMDDDDAPGCWLSEIAGGQFLPVGVS